MPKTVRRLRLVIFTLAPFVASCDSHAKEVMACAASEDWGCPVEQIAVKGLGAATYRITGCGRDVTYYCKMPGEGCITNDPKPVVLGTARCRSQ